MEVKLSYKKHISLSKSLLSNHTKTSILPHTLHLKPWAAAEIHSFKGLVKKWRLQNKSEAYSCTHLVKGGETLSSISKMYGVSVHSIAAANKTIVDIDLVFKGQLLNVPASSLLDTQLDRVKKSRLWHSIRAIKTPSGQKNFTNVTSHGLSNAKSTGYFLLLVPLIAFCIGFIISTFRERVDRGIRHQAADKSQAHHPGSKGMRWKSALDDSVEGDFFYSKLGLDSNVDRTYDCDILKLLSVGLMPPDPENARYRLHRGCHCTEIEDAIMGFAMEDCLTARPSDDEACIWYEEISEDYGRLEHDYQKFLSECGISKCGYWRGGSPGPAEKRTGY